MFHYFPHLCFLSELAVLLVDQPQVQNVDPVQMLNVESWSLLMFEVELAMLWEMLVTQLLLRLYC